MLCDSMEACAMDVVSEFSISVNKAVEVDSSWSGLWWKTVEYLRLVELGAVIWVLSEFFHQVKVLWTLLTIIHEQKGIVRLGWYKVS
jgi:hypothetical protein